MLSKLFSHPTSLVAKIACAQSFVLAQVDIRSYLHNIELTNPTMSTPFSSSKYAGMIYPFNTDPAFDWSAGSWSSWTTDTYDDEYSWHQSDFAGGEQNVNFVRVLTGTFQEDDLPGTTVSVGDTLCGTFPEAMLE